MKHYYETIIEAALLTTSQPLTNKALRSLFSPTISSDALNDVMDNLAERWQNRALVLNQSTQGWQFLVADEIAKNIPHLYEEKYPRYSRAVMETLAIIAYQQPCTRGDIENVRGVAVSTQIIQTLSDRGWIEVVGQKDSPGKPSLWATTTKFLHDLQLTSLDDLPPLQEIGQLLEEQVDAANDSDENKKSY